jgi:hypothetical protein
MLITIVPLYAAMTLSDDSEEEVRDEGAFCAFYEVMKKHAGKPLHSPWLVKQVGHVENPGLNEIVHEY